MTDQAAIAPLRALVRRDRLVVLSSLFGLAALGWLLAFNLGEGMDMMTASVGVTLALWLVMMVAMMTPSVSPILLMYVGILRSRAIPPFALAGIFLLGYLLVWSGFSAAASLAQWAWHDMISGAALIGGSVLIAAGIFQLTPLKHACLAQCRSPQGFFMTGWREGAPGALTMGLRHGAYCLGCCWLLMSILLVTGAMNVVLMAAIAGYVLVEKVLPGGKWLSWAAGLALVGAGTWMIIGGL